MTNVVSMNEHRKQPKHTRQTHAYKGHTIVLTYRPLTNDWLFAFEHHMTLRRTGMAPRLDTALRNAKEEIDVLVASDRGAAS